MNSETVIENVFRVKEPVAEDALAEVFRVEIDLQAFDYNLLYAYTQVQGETHVERVRAAGEYARRLAGKRLDPETIRTILETHGMPLPQKDALILLAKEGVDVEHFRNEWRNLLFLNHPHLVQVYGGGIWQGHPYCVMERFGDPLAPNLASSKLGLPDKLAIAIAAGEGVAHLHENGLVHWDLRPENILILPAGDGGGGYTAKVTALGLTHGIDELLGKASAGEVLESLCCMAPEMVRGEGVGAHSDIYSLGACLYLLMTGHLPHDRKKRLFEIFESLRTGEAPTSARELVPDLPEGVANMLDRAMAADPALRYGSMQEMLADLRALRADPDAPIIPLFKTTPTTPAKAAAPSTPPPAPASTEPAPSGSEVPAVAEVPVAGHGSASIPVPPVAPPTTTASAAPEQAPAPFQAGGGDGAASSDAGSPAPGGVESLPETVDATWVTSAMNMPHASADPAQAAPEPVAAVPADAAMAYRTPLVQEEPLPPVREPLAPPLPDTESTMPRVADTQAPRPSGSIAGRLVRTVLVLAILGGVGYAVHQSRTTRIPDTLVDPSRPTKTPGDTPAAPTLADALTQPEPDARLPEDRSTQPEPEAGRIDPEPDAPLVPVGEETAPVTDVDAQATTEPAADPALDPEYVRLMQLAHAAMRAQDFDAAMNHAAEALQHELTSEATGILEAARARKHFRETRNQAVDRGRLLLEEGKWKEAEDAVQRALVIEQYMQDEEALAIQRAAREGQYDAVMERADRLLAAEDFDAAEMAYMEAMMIDGYATDARAVEGQRRAFQAKMDATEAARAEDRQRRQMEMKYSLSMEEAQRLMEERKWLQAVQVLDTVLGLEGYENDPAALEARQKAARMTQEDPTHLKAQFEQFMVRGQAFSDAGEREEAVEAFRRAMQIEGFADNPEAMAKLHEAQTAPPPEKPDPHATDAAPDAAPAADPAFLHMYGQASRLAAEGNLGGAKTILEQIRAMPGYGNHPQVVEAIRRIDAAPRTPPTRPAPTPSRNLQGDLDAARGDPLRQIQIYDEALRTRSGDRALQVRRLYALIDAGRFEEARSDAEALSQRHADDAWVHAALGTVYRQDGLYRSAAEAFEKAVAAGSPNEAVAVARFGLGELHFSSGRAGDFRTGITQDNERAVAYLEQAAEAGNPAAMNNLGVAHAVGRGARRDRGTAVDWFAKAAEAGDPKGQYNYALALELGSGVDRDEEAAASWYGKAVAQGESRAAARLADMVRRGRGVERDEQRARQLQEQGQGENLRDRSFLLALQSRALPPLPVIQAEPRPDAPVRVQLPDVPGVAAPEPDTSTLQGIRPGAEAAMRFQSIMEEGQRLLIDGDAEQARQVFALALRVPGYEDNVMARTNMQAAEQLLAAQRRAAPPPEAQPGAVVDEETVSPQEAQYKSMMEEGRRLIIEQKWDEAVDVYTQILRIPEYTFDAEAQNALRMAREARDVEAAARRPGYTLTPEERTTREYLAFMRKGHEQLAQKQWVVAKTIFGYALELPGYEEDPNALAGQRAAEEGLRGEVIARQPPIEIEMDMRDTATYTAMMQEAVRQYQQGRYDGAIQLFNMVLELEGYEADNAATRGLLMAQQLRGSDMRPDPSVTLEWLQAGHDAQTPPRAPEEPAPAPPAPPEGIFIPPVEQTPPMEDAAQPPPDARLPASPDPGVGIDLPPVPITPPPPSASMGTAPAPPSPVEIPDIPQPPTAQPAPPAPVAVVPEDTPAPLVPAELPSDGERARMAYQDLMVEASRLLSRGAYEEAEAQYRRALAQPGYEDDPMARIGVETAIRERERVAASTPPPSPTDPAPSAPEVDESLFELPMRPDADEGADVDLVRIEERGIDIPVRERSTTDDGVASPDGIRDALADLFADEPPPAPAIPEPTATPVPHEAGRLPPVSDPPAPEADIFMDDFELPARAGEVDVIPPHVDPIPPMPAPVAESLPDASAFPEDLVPPVPDAVPPPPTDFTALVPPPPAPVSVPTPPEAVPPAPRVDALDEVPTAIRLDDMIPPIPDSPPVPHTVPAPPPVDTVESAASAPEVDLAQLDPFRDLLADPDLRPRTEGTPGTETASLPEVPVLPESLRHTPELPEAFDAPRTPVQPAAVAGPAVLHAERMEEGRRHMDARAWDRAQEAFEAALRVPGYERDADALAARDQARERARVLAQRPTPRQLMKEGNRLENMGQFEEAIVAYTTALEMEPGNVALLISRADASVRAGQFRSAIADYEHVLTLELAPATQTYAYNHLANAYYFSEIDFARAAAYYRKAADAGDAAAMNSLGVCYGLGRGVERNARTSLDWYRRAAERGYGLAMVNLGLAYQAGRDVEADYPRARMWYERAAEAGVPRAYVRLAILYEQGLGVEVDLERAADFRRRARALGYQADG